MARLIDPDHLRDRKRRWREWNRARAAEHAAWAARGYQHPPPPTRTPPPDLIGLPCGARTRAGTPCKRTDIWENGRCKLHGGLSTGPRTAEGAARARANLRRRWNPMRG